MEFKRLKKWEKELNICIRCGYCYEHCPFLKQTGWETDTPRGKLLLLYGMLTGKLEPSEEIVERIYECFFCNSCFKSCAAKVPVTDILHDARLDFADAGFDVQGIAAHSNEELCGYCGMCISVCKYEAISRDEENRKILVDVTKCTGCGACVATCPTGAMSQREGFGVSKAELEEKVLRVLETAPQAG